MRISTARNRIKAGVFSVLLMALFACTDSTPKNDDPVRVLTDYISKSFAVNSAADRKGMLEYLTGDVKNRLVAWSDEQFTQAFVQSKRKFTKLLIRENKKVSETEVSITYELSYLDTSKTAETRVTNRKLATLVKEQSRWLIRDVRSIKELVEYQNEIALP